MRSTRDVLHNHIASFGRRDLDGILADYAPGAILFTPEGQRVGVDAIRPVFTGLLADFAKPGASFELKHESVNGEYAYIWWTAETADNRYELVTDTFFVRGGKIEVQSFAARILAKS